MVCYGIMLSKKFIVSIVFILFIHQSTSKTKRSKKDPVFHVKRRHSNNATGVTVPSIIEDVEDLAKLESWTPDVDVGAQSGRRLVSCPSRCESCDAAKGCTKCRSRTFLYLATTRTGVCLHTCPSGYFGSRGKDTSMCRKCSVPNCATCFTIGYCTKCMPEYYLHGSDECLKTCPDNMAPNEENGRCEEKVDCEVGAWSSWSKCARRSASRSCKYGRKKRTRPIVQEPTDNGKECPKLKDSKKCRTPSSKCPLINKWYQRQLRKMNRKKNRKGKKGKNRKINEVRSNDTNSRTKTSNNRVKT